MSRFAAFALVLATQLPVSAADFQSAQLVNDGVDLLITSSTGKVVTAPRRAEQWVYADPQVSSDRRLVGWLVAYHNAGASYPLPTELVVLDDSNQLHTFVPRYGMLVRWCFSRSARAVAIAYAFPHGSYASTLEMRAVRDGRLLTRFEVPNGEHESAHARKNAPGWAQCLLEGTNAS
jgi:hypothetical protein